MADPSETTQVSLGPQDPDSAELLDAVRSLAVQVGGLQAELKALRAQTRPLPEPADVPAWDTSKPARREQSQWMRSLDRPGPRPPALPRLLLEVVFLVAVAGAAAIAELDPVVIVVLMAGALALVAAAEWLAAEAARRQAAVSAMPLAGGGGVVADDPSWFAPPLERVARPRRPPARSGRRGHRGRRRARDPPAAAHRGLRTRRREDGRPATELRSPACVSASSRRSRARLALVAIAATAGAATGTQRPTVLDLGDSLSVGTDPYLRKRLSGYRIERLYDVGLHAYDAARIVSVSRRIAPAGARRQRRDERRPAERLDVLARGRGRPSRGRAMTAASSGRRSRVRRQSARRTTD